MTSRVSNPSLAGGDAMVGKAIERDPRAPDAGSDVNQAHRVLLRVGGSHVLVAVRLECVGHIALQHDRHGPLDHVVRLPFAPDAAKPDLRHWSPISQCRTCFSYL